MKLTDEELTLSIALLRLLAAKPMCDLRREDVEDELKDFYPFTLCLPSAALLAGNTARVRTALAALPAHHYPVAIACVTRDGWLMIPCENRTLSTK